MSKRLDPSGLAGAFARKKTPTALDFLVPTRAPQPEAAPEPVVAEPAAPSFERATDWSPSAPGRPERLSLQRLVGRTLERLVGVVLNRVMG